MTSDKGVVERLRAKERLFNQEGVLSTGSHKLHAFELRELFAKAADRIETLERALRPFAECKFGALYGDEAKTSLRIKIGPDAFTAEQFVGPKLGDFRRARAALSPPKLES